MPVINFSYSDLCELVGREVPRNVLRERLPLLGADLRTVDDRSDEMSFEFFPDRPDLYSVEGIARALRAFLGHEPGLRSYAVGEAEVDLVVDPSVKQVRPFIWSALVEGNEMTDPLIRSVMDLQEKLHITVGRNRKKVAIGIHDFATVKPPFTYKAVLPDEISFVPLQDARSMTPSQILKEHEKGRAYAFVLEGKERYPMIVDREETVLSFPPIINGVTTAITESTRDIFVDCTGTDINAVTLSVNILTTALAERGGKIKSVNIVQDGGTAKAPDLLPRDMDLDTDLVNSWIGTGLSDSAIAECLMRMGHGASVRPGGVLAQTPSYRGDILHQVDLAEDVAIGYGFERFGKSLPTVLTFGTEDGLTRFCSSLKDVMIGLGYFEVVTLSLSNPREQYTFMSSKESKDAIHVRNPVSIDHVLLRTSLLPSLMTILRRNKHRELPQRVFEIGDVVIGTRNKRLMAGASTHARASFTEVKSLVQSIFSSIGLEMRVSPGEHPSFMPGRCATASSGEHDLGVFGELSPGVIESFELKNPIVAFELDVETMREVAGRGTSD